MLFYSSMYKYVLEDVKTTRKTRKRMFKELIKYTDGEQPQFSWCLKLHASLKMQLYVRIQIVLKIEFEIVFFTREAVNEIEGCTTFNAD